MNAINNNDTASNNPMSPDFDLNVSTATPIEKPRAKRASNDATVEVPIKAVDAMALCMKDSAFGG